MKLNSYYQLDDEFVSIVSIYNEQDFPNMCKECKARECQKILWTQTLKEDDPSADQGTDGKTLSLRTNS